MSLPGITGMHGLVGASASGGGLAASTLFLCRFGVSPPLDEVSSNTGTLVGNATVNTANNYVTLDGTGDWVTFPASAVFDMNTTDFTIEIHASIASGQVGGAIGHQVIGDAAPHPGRWSPFCNGNGTIDFYADNVNGGAPIIDFGAGAANGTMRHYAVVRQGSSWKTFVGGTLKSSVSQSGSIGVASPAAVLHVGTDPFNTTSRDIAANIGRVKLSNVALWTASFTAPAITDA